MRTMPARRIYFLQEILTRPEDYFILAAEYNQLTLKQEGDLIAHMVVDPERVSDDLLILIGLEDEGFRRLPPYEKLDRKILHVKAIKDFFRSTVPLALG